jgi:hypothetical protein
MGLCVDRWARKPNCSGGRRLWDSSRRLSRLVRILSKILPVMLSREIGRYDLGSLGPLPGLGIIMVHAVFHAVGKYSVFMQLL